MAPRRVATSRRCGYQLRVTGPLDSSFELFLARADVHIEETCSALPSRTRPDRS